MQFFKSHILLFTIVPLFILFVAASYVRFMIQLDYLVSYEGECDPYTESCFLYCEDEECSDPFYYTTIERQAKEIYDRCGLDVSECEEAQTCQSDVAVCNITYCDINDPQTECETLNNEDQPLNSNSNKS